MSPPALQAARRAVLARFAQAWNERDVEALMGCMAEDCAFHAAAGADPEGTRHLGRDAVRAAYSAIFEAFPQAHWAPSHTLLQGDCAFTGWRFTGTTAAGAPVEVEGGDLLVFAGEKIALKDSYRKMRS